MGGLDISITYETKRHNDQCPQAKLDDRIEELIKELKDVCFGLEQFDNESVSKQAGLLEAWIPKIKAWKIMQLFPEFDQRLSDEQRAELIEKAQPFVEQYEDEDKCEACRKNVFCLVTAPAMTIFAVQENLEIALRSQPSSAEVDQVQNKIEALLDRALYIQSRASDLYYGGLL